MKRLLSLLLVIAMLFGICTVFTACDSSSSVSDEDDDDDDKKKNDKDDDDEDKDDDDEEEEPTLVLKGLKIVLPEDFELDSKDSYDDNSAYASFSSDKYGIDISCGPLEGEVEGMNAEDLRDFFIDQMDPDDEDSEVGEWGKKEKNGTCYFYAIKDDNTTAVVFSFYAVDGYGWQVQIYPQDDVEDFKVGEMVNLVTGWKCSAPDPEDEDDDDDDDDVIGTPDSSAPVESAPSNNDNVDSTGISVDEAVVYSNLGITITATDLYIDSYGYNFVFDVENTSGYLVALSGNNAVINDTSTAYLSMYGEVEDGATSQVEASIPYDAMDMLGAQTIGELEFTLIIYDAEAYEYLDEGTSVYVTTSDYGYQNLIDVNGTVLFDQEGLYVVLQSIDLEDEYYPKMTVYVQNYGSEPATVNLENIVVNGWVLPSDYFYCHVMPGTFTVDTMDLSDLELIGITDVDEIQNITFDANCYHSTQYYTIYAEDGIGYYPGDADFVQSVPLSGTTLYDDGMLTLMLIQMEENYSSVQVWLYLRNNSDQFVTVELDDTTINGYESGNSFYSYLPAGSQCLDWMNLWFTEDADFESLNDLQSLAVTLEVSDEGYGTDIEQTITIPVN